MVLLVVILLYWSIIGGDLLGFCLLVLGWVLMYVWFGGCNLCLVL